MKANRTPSSEIDDMMRADAGKGIENARISDRADWHSYANGYDGEWLNALEAFDRGNRKRLLALLRSDAEMSADIRHHLADLLDRSKTSGRRTPSYDRTLAEQRMSGAVADVRRLTAGLSEKESIAEVARITGIDENNLALACNGQLGSMRRMRARLPKRPAQ